MFLIFLVKDDEGPDFVEGYRATVTGDNHMDTNRTHIPIGVKDGTEGDGAATKPRRATTVKRPEKDVV